MEKNKHIEDPNLSKLNDDPRNLYPNEKGKAQRHRGAGRNTESFDPKSTIVRPSMRILVGPNQPVYGKPTKHDDVVIVPEFFCKEDDWTMYYKLIDEMRETQKTKEGKQAEWVSWHEGAHLISKDPSASTTFQMIQNKMAAYFEIPMQSVGTRFNWYVNSSDWKPFHHDSAAFNFERARNQNITVGVSFGRTRELAFLSATTGEKIYFPQTNGMLFAFGKDVNINWKHGVNALPENEQDGKGRISIILWGLTKNVIDEKGSPPMLTDNTRGNGYSIHKPDTYVKESKTRFNRDNGNHDEREDYSSKKNYKHNQHGYDNFKDRSRSRDDYNNDGYNNKRNGHHRSRY